MWVIFALQSLFAISFIVFKKALLYADPIFLVAIRMLISGALMLAWYYLFQPRVKWTQGIVFLVFVASVFNIYLTNVPEIVGLQYVSAAKANFIYSFSPFLTAIFSYFFLQEKLNLRKIMGLLLSFVGFLVILFGQNNTEQHLNHLFFISSAELLIILASVATIFGWIAIKKLVCVDRTSIAFANGTSMLIGGGISLVHSLMVENWHPLPVSDMQMMVAWSMAGVLFSCLLAYNWNAYLLKTFSATFMSLSGLISPAFTAILGLFILQEPITLHFVISFILVFFGTYIFFRQESKGK